MSKKSNPSPASRPPTEGGRRAGKTAVSGTGRQDEDQFVTFLLGAEEFGVPIDFVKEIVGVPEVTRIPRAPSWLEGIANLRGSVLPLVNLRDRFALEDRAVDEDTRVVVVELGGSLTGVIVDRVSEVMRVGRRVVEAPPAVVRTALDVHFLDGVAKLGDGNRLVQLLDIEAVLPTRADLDEVVEKAAAGATSRQRDRVALEENAHEEEQLVSFYLGNEEYALDIDDVQEIIRVPEVSRVPRAPADVEGVVALRNRLLPILNLRKRFGLAAAKERHDGEEDDTRIVVLDAGGTLTGIMVDGVSEVLGVPVDAIEPPPEAVTGSEAVVLRGVAKLQEGKRLIMLLDGARFLARGEAETLEELARDAGAAEAAESGARSVDEGESAGEQQFVSFRLADEEFGVDIQRVQEIIWLPEITAVPGAPPFVKGIVNLRGAVLPVVDLRMRFELDATVFDDDTSILVLDHGGSKTGLIVDQVSEVVRLPSRACEPAPEGIMGADGGFVRGVGKPGDDRMLILLDLDRVLGWERRGGLAAAANTAAA